MERNQLQTQLDQFRKNNEVGVDSGDQTDAIKEQTLQENENIDEVRELCKRRLYENSELCASQQFL